MTSCIDSGSVARNDESNSNLNEDEEELKKIAYEKEMMDIVDKGNFDEIEKKITPRNFTECSSSSLRVAMEVSFKLREKAKRKGPDNERFNHLANSVEEFVFCFLDPLRPGAKKEERQQFGEYVLHDIFYDAVDFQQKKIQLETGITKLSIAIVNKTTNKAQFEEPIGFPIQYDYLHAQN
ncbi:uncharacterized protein [Montipora capricornis]|uniref:uncharacterized protein n=1 Tax=Montipora capricornis TaxID=246305 RepID=UPI0035F10EEF